MPDITLIAHNIRSTHNVGAIFRTAEGLGVAHIVLSGYTPYPLQDNDTRLPHISRKLTSQIHKSALGAEAIVPFTHVESLQNWMEMNRNAEQPLPLYALEQHERSQNIKHFTPADRFALLLGEEVHGIPDDIVDVCDEILEIPMYGTKESFNVSVATGIALFALT